MESQVSGNNLEATKEKTKRTTQSRKDRKERRERKKKRNEEEETSTELNNEPETQNNGEPLTVTEISQQKTNESAPENGQMLSPPLKPCVRTPSPALIGNDRKNRGAKGRERIASSSGGRPFASNPAISIYRPRESITKIQSLNMKHNNSSTVVNNMNNLQTSIKNFENNNNNNNNGENSVENNNNGSENETEQIKVTQLNENNESNNQHNNNEEIIVETEESKEIERLKEEVLKSVLNHEAALIQPKLIALKSKLPDGNLNFRYPDGLTITHMAIQNKCSKELLKNLIDNGVSVHIPTLSGLSPLHFAAQLGDFSSSEFLLANKANPMQRDFDNRSCLHLAVEGGNLACVELISKQSGVLVNHRDNMGYSALHLAVKLEKKEIADFLLNKGADPILMDNFGNRPIDLIPGFSRFITTKNVKLSPQGKKIMKLLKKRGGHKMPVYHQKNEFAIGGGMARSRSLDHRNPSISPDFVKTLQSKGSNVNINNISNNNNITSSGSVAVTLSPNLLDKKEIEKKEANLQLLYYNPDDRSKAEETPPPAPLSPIKKTDKYGFYTSQNENVQVNDAKHNLKEEKLAMKWLEFTKNWDDIDIKNKKNVHYEKKLQKYCDKGIPDSVRGLVWKLLAGCKEKNDVTYEELLQRDSIPKVKEQILKDINRTMPNHILFQEKGQGQQMLTNVLTAYSVYKPSVGYCQGMGFITAMFLMYMPEEDAFWMLDRIADEYRFAGLWEEKMVLVTQCMSTLNILFQSLLPDVYAKIEEHNIPPVSYVPQFFLTGFLYSLPFSMVVRIWDSFLLRKFDFLYAVAIALFKVNRDKLAKMKMEEFIMFIKFKDSGEELEFTTEKLLKSSISIWSKLNSNYIRKLEEEGGKAC